MTNTIRSGHLPIGIAVGAGSVWVANSGDGTVTRIDPATNKPIITITVGGSPQQIAVAQGRGVGDGRRPDDPAHPRRRRAPAQCVLTTPTSTSAPWIRRCPADPQLLYATCANLLNYPDKPGSAGSQLVPEVAQSWPTRSADGKSYTFTIRSGFRFSPPSTEVVTARTFKYSIERTLNPHMNSPLAADFRDIVGAPAYMAGKAAHVSGVLVRGNTLTVRLDRARSGHPRADRDVRLLRRPDEHADRPPCAQGPVRRPVPRGLLHPRPGNSPSLRKPNYPRKPTPPASADRDFVGTTSALQHAVSRTSKAGTVDYAAGAGFRRERELAVAGRQVWRREPSRPEAGPPAVLRPTLSRSSTCSR